MNEFDEEFFKAKIKKLNEEYQSAFGKEEIHLSYKAMTKIM